MDKKKRRRDRLQNLLIAALSLSAIYLFFLTQAGPLDLQLPEIDLSSPAATEELPTEVSLLQELDWPVTLVASDGSGARYFRQLSTADSSFTAVEGLWENLFRQPISAIPVSDKDFQQALTRPGVYVSFPSPVPFCILSARLGLPSSNEMPLLRLLLVTAGSAVRFYYSDGEHYYLSHTSLATEELSATLDSIDGDACRFAFEQEEASSLHPLSVLPAELPQYTLLSAVSSEESDSGRYLSFFGFNAHTTNRYVDASGTEVIVESPRRLTMAPGGRISYLGSTAYAPEGFVLSAEENPPLSELVDGAYRLLTQLSSGGSELRFYLSSADYEHGAGQCTLRFERMVEGLPLLSGDGEPAAELLIEDGVVIDCSFLSRSYAHSEIPTLLLPLRQASAIAAQYEGMEMALSYVDSGGDSAAVAWLMR